MDISEFKCIDSMWFYLYSQQSHRRKVLKWIKKEQIFSKKYVFIPIVLWLVFGWLNCEVVMPAKMNINGAANNSVLWNAGVTGVFWFYAT